jgi:hypothetical protein
LGERRVASAVLALTGAALMALSPFLDWYRVKPGDSEPIDLSGWDSFEVFDCLLLGAAFATAVMVARRGSGLAGRRLLGLGAITAALIVIELIDKPPLLAFSAVDVSLRVGAWLAFAGALLVLVAGALTSRPRR